MTELKNIASYITFFQVFLMYIIIIIIKSSHIKKYSRNGYQLILILQVMTSAQNFSDPKNVVELFLELL